MLTRRHRSWHVSTDDLEAYRKTLFDPRRLQAHRRLFERETAGGAGGESEGRIFGLGNHSRVDRKRPVILDSREPLFIRAFHDQQDSPPRRRMEGEPADPDALRARFRLEGVALPSLEQSRTFYRAYEEARREAKRKGRGSALGQIAKRFQLGG